MGTGKRFPETALPKTGTLQNLTQNLRGCSRPRLSSSFWPSPCRHPLVAKIRSDPRQSAPAKALARRDGWSC
jgi:hypothetical protein